MTDHRAADAPEGVAIIGMAGRFPGARDVAAFWRNIKDGVESVSTFAEHEMDVPAPPTREEGARYVRAKGVLDDVDLFDARFFGYLPREAELMDPQQRLFLELAHDAFETAGYDTERYPGAVGVFGGCYMDTYLLANLCTSPEFLARLVESIQVGSLQTELGNDKDYVTTRVSFKLGLRGPSLNVQTACSTSLVAIALAVQSLQSYQCDMALAGGVTITFPQRKGYFYKEGGMLSPDGHCRPFDAQAAGTVFSNGAALVVLKRLSDAVADGDTIYAVILGAGLNNDGSQKVSYTAPSVDGQAEVIALAQGLAGVEARTIGYVEAHGTATPLGDPIEIAGLTKAFRQSTEDSGYCAIGSVKSNLGHLDVASGAIGTIKTALSLKEGLLPPTLHFTSPNPTIDFSKTPFFVNDTLRPWKREAWPRRAGVSSFGVGGTNAHVVMEEPPLPTATAAGRTHQLLTLSAKSDVALDAAAARLADHVESQSDIDLEDAAYTLQLGRRVFEHRRIVVCSDASSAAARLRGKPAAGDRSRTERADPPVVFLFPGQGAQHPNMARSLYESEGAFRESLDACAEGLAGQIGFDLRTLLFPAAGTEEDAARALMQTEVAQPAIVSVEISLARLLMSWGVRPSALIGHSVGEFAAACIGGVFTLEETLALVRQRGRLMQLQPPGIMLAVRSAADDLKDFIGETVALAAVNAPQLSVLSGPREVIEAVKTALEERGVGSTVLFTSHAFHSSMMDPVVDPLVEAARGLNPRASEIPIVSTALGRTLEPDEARNPEYWGRQLRQPVLFADAVRSLAADASHVFVEVGPGQTLGTLGRQSVASFGPRTVVSCLGPASSPGADLEHLLTAVGRLWLAGVPVDYARMARHPRRRIPLPTYPFERKRFWVESARAEEMSRATRTGAGGNGRATAEPVAAAPTMADAHARTRAILQRQLELMAEQLALFGSRE